MMEQEEDFKGIGDYLAILKRRKKLLFIPAIVIFALAAIVAFSLPSIYRSEATILIEQQQIPTDLVRSTVTSFAGERIQIISQRVMTTENISKIIDNYGLYKEERKETSMAMLVEAMRKKISLEMISADVIDPRSGRPTSATIAFKLSFSHKNPRIAQKITNELVSLYLNENLKQRTKSAVETSGFLESEANKLKANVAILEENLASFKEKNMNMLPELQQLNIQLMERSERELKDTDTQLRSLEERTIYLRSELAQMDPNSSSYGSDGRRILSASDRLKTLESERISMSARYSPTHPDLIRIGKEITALKKETGATGDTYALQKKVKELNDELVNLQGRYSAKHPDVKKLQRSVNAASAALKQAKKDSKSNKRVDAERADNPAYLQLRTQLQAAEGEIRSLKRTRVGIKKKVGDFEQRLLQSPQVERKYHELTRDYDNALAKYKEVKGKQLEAELATSLEREHKGERFSLIEPPLVPEKPAKPNRPAILFLGFILALAGGIGLVVVTESLNSSIRSPMELVSVTLVPPLIVVPYIETEAERAGVKIWQTRYLVGIMMLAILSVGLFHWLVMPLDVLWFVVMRKLGLSEQ